SPGKIAFVLFVPGEQSAGDFRVAVTWHDDKIVPLSLLVNRCIRKRIKVKGQRAKRDKIFFLPLTFFL
ncbi:MAG TPA: hypothetical protein VF336_00825, partial [Syntrophales bacterium]